MCLQRFIDNAGPECLHLDYKSGKFFEDLKNKNPEIRKRTKKDDVAKDIKAMANSGGGFYLRH